MHLTLRHVLLYKSHIGRAGQSAGRGGLNEWALKKSPSQIPARIWTAIGLWGSLLHSGADHHFVHINVGRLFEGISDAAGNSRGGQRCAPVFDHQFFGFVIRDGLSQLGLRNPR